MSCIAFYLAYLQPESLP